jgi:hypothetical protein
MRECILVLVLVLVLGFTMDFEDEDEDENEDELKRTASYTGSFSMVFRLLRVYAPMSVNSRFSA